MTGQRRLLVLMLLVLALALAGGAGWSRLVLEPRLTALAASEQTALQAEAWQRLVADRAHLLDLAADDLERRPGLTPALARADATGLGAIAGAAAPDAARRYGVDGIELLGRDGSLVFSSWQATAVATATAPPFLARAGSDTALAAAARTGFVQHGRGVLLSVDRPLGDSGAVPVGRLRVQAGLEGLLEALRGDSDLLASVIDLRHQPVAETGRQEWQAAALAAATAEMPQTRWLDGRLLLASPLALTDIAGRPLGQIVIVRPLDERAAVSRALAITLTLLATAAMLLLSLLVVRGLTAEFGPLRRAVAVLEGLARGETDVSLAGLASGTAPTDEIGRLTAAARTLRERTLLLVTLRLSRARQHRREQRFLRQQLTGLAEALEGEARATVLRDLRRLEAEAPGNAPERPAELLPALRSGEAAGATEGGDFALLAGAFQNLTHRLRDQHGRLTALVEELNEALRAKTEFQLLQKELDLARTLQLSILPDDLPDHDGIAAHGLMMPAREVGGDFYDVFPLPDGTLALVVADVSGKGVPAAFFSLICRTLLKATAQLGLAPGACIEKVNALLCAENDQLMFVTLFFGVLDPADGRLAYVNAGHNWPLLLRADGTVATVPGTGDMALGVFDDNAYRQAELRLAAGDLLLIYTDGVTEAFAGDGAAFGDDRLHAVLHSAGRTPTWMVPKSVSNAVRAFEGETGPADDLTCLAVGYRRGT